MTENASIGRLLAFFAPAQSHFTDAVVYMEPTATPTPQITTPAQTHTTDTVMYMAETSKRPS